MKVMKGILPMISLAVLITSCKKEDNQPDPAPEVRYANFTMLKPGNYWIYRHFQVDSSGNETPLNVYDSCYVEKDTLINGSVYFKVIRPSVIPDNSVSFQKDSLHYLVDANGKILFSSLDFNSIFDQYIVTGSTAADTICTVETRMAAGFQQINTPSGNYNTLNCRSDYNFVPPWNNNGNVRHINVRYAPNVGIVEETLPFYVSVPYYHVRKLERFHLN